MVNEIDLYSSDSKNISNVPEFSVSEISRALKSVVEDHFDYIKVRGEISGYKLAPSGHVYFSLKDENSVLAAICWKNIACKLSVKLEEGLEVVCSGSITTFAGQSKYQLNVETIEPAGIGALMAIFMQRKDRLTKEGLFDDKRKKPLPFLPKVIGIVTSPTGAVIKDILHRIRERCPVNIILCPVLVQGEHAAKQVAEAIYRLNNLPDHIAKPDVIIVARGGGSIEDLWAFNEEIVVRATAESIIPIISAIGHETDTTLIDFASDKRAPTPTAAAEMAVPVLQDILIKVKDYESRLIDSSRRIIQEKTNNLIILSRSLPHFIALIQGFEQRLDDLTIRLGLSLPRFLDIKYKIMYEYSYLIKTPNYLIESYIKHIKFSMQLLRQIINKYFQQKKFALSCFAGNININSLNIDIINKQDKLQIISERMAVNAKHLISFKINKLDNIAALLQSYHYKGTLNRGFAIISEGDHIITSITDIKVGAQLKIELKDGSKTILVAKPTSNIIKEIKNRDNHRNIKQQTLF